MGGRAQANSYLLTAYHLAPSDPLGLLLPPFYGGLTEGTEGEITYSEDTVVSGGATVRTQAASLDCSRS